MNCTTCIYWIIYSGVVFLYFPYILFKVLNKILKLWACYIIENHTIVSPLALTGIFIALYELLHV